MTQLTSLLAALTFVVSVSAFADAQDGAYLDSPYRNLHRPTLNRNSHGSQQEKGLNDAVARRSDTSALIAHVTPVRAQLSRGTCSIFSATAMLESMMVIKGYADVSTADYSEEWLEYLITRGRTGDGSSSNANFNTFVRYGTAQESSLPYVGETWDTPNFSPLANQRCSRFTDFATQKSCLLGHRDPSLLSTSDADLLNASSASFDPEFQKARTDAAQFRAQYMGRVRQGWTVGSESDIKTLLSAGIPVVLDIDFYYGAWNHRKAEGFGIGRNLEQWSQGIVGYPEPGSMDILKTREEPAGHSILLVGYNDDVVVNTDVLMQDGTRQQFSYAGVYYLKNSWGTAGFGSQFTLDGVAHPGYGMITQKYAHEYGGFYKFSLGN